MIVDALYRFEFDGLNFESVLEVGCASGPNLFRIHREFPEERLSGTDVMNWSVSEAGSRVILDLRGRGASARAFRSKFASQNS